MSIIPYGFIGGNYGKVLKYVDQAEQQLKHFQGDLPEEIKAFHTSWLWYKTVIYAYMGNLARNFKAANKLLAVGQLYDQQRGISDGKFELGRYYWLFGDLDNALVHLDSAIKLSEENLNGLMDFIKLAGQLWVAIRVSIDNEDIERAKRYFKRLEEIMKLKASETYINGPYRLAKAFLLKTSMRFRDRVMAEDLLREVMAEGSSLFMHKLRAVSALCELLLVELKLSNDITIITEIKPLLEKLIEMAQQSGLYYYLIDALIMHGKLALITFDMESSRRYLKQAQQLAEKYGYIGLADEIAGIHETMMEKKDIWEQMKKRNAPLSERMDLARLDDHLKGKFLRLIMKMERVADSPPKKDVF